MGEVKYDVLIADDEIYVASLIEQIIDWDALNMRIVGKAENGRVALAMIEQLEPDIVIVDVCMPGFDGLTVMQKVREVNNRIKFIIISGHKRFEYAKSAMQYNVEDYLLKPINQEELETILHKLKRKLSAEHAHEQQMVLLEQLDNSRERMHAHLVLSLKNGEITEKAAEAMQQVNQGYLTRFASGAFSGLILKLDGTVKKIDHSFRQELLRKLAGILLKHVREICFESISRQENQQVLFVLNYPTKAETPLYELLEMAMKEIDKVLVEFNPLCTTLAVGEPVTCFSSTGESLAGAEQAVDARICLGTGQILYGGKIPRDIGLLDVVLPDTHRQHLLEAIKTFDRHKIQKAAEQIFHRAREYERKYPGIYIALAQEIFRILYDYIHLINLYSEPYETFYLPLAQQLENCINSWEIKNALLDEINAYMEEFVYAGRSNENPAVRIVKRYIAENYNTNISLASAAQIVSLTPVYLSILFKKETGTNFVDYLTHFRIQNSKTLLKDVRYNVSQVALECGFQDTRYFSKIFKKNVGITPSQYRSRHVN